MKTLLMILLLVGTVRAGDTYACIESKGDYYAPRPVTNQQIVVATDTARYEPRWHAMLDPNDLRDLTFIEARRRSVYVIERNP